MNFYFLQQEFWRLEAKIYQPKYQQNTNSSTKLAELCELSLQSSAKNRICLRFQSSNYTRTEIKNAYPNMTTASV